MFRATVWGDALAINSKKKAEDMKKQPKSQEAKASKRRHRHEAEAGLGGALAGAAIGIVGGPPGAMAGAVIGGVVGAVVAGVAEVNAADLAAIDRQLDEDIGVVGGDIGAPNLKHPPVKAGLFSAASVGGHDSGERESADGPILRPPGS